MQTIYLIRHGLPEGAELRRYLGHTDVLLSLEGFRQARQVAQHLSDVPLDAIYCSDLLRASQTADVIARTHGKQPKPLQALREVNMGQWDGKTFAQIQSQFPEEYEKRGQNPADHRPPGGESLAQCAERAWTVWLHILFASPPEAHIAVVTHAGLIRALLCRLLDIPIHKIFTIKQDYCCINVICFDRFSPHNEQFRLCLLNGRAH